MLGIELGTADGDADECALFGMELGADNGTSDGALLGHATVVVLLGSAEGATTVGTAGGTACAADGAANDGILLGIEPGLLDNTLDGSLMLVHLMVIRVLQCLVSILVQ